MARQEYHREYCIDRNDYKYLEDLSGDFSMQNNSLLVILFNISITGYDRLYHMFVNNIIIVTASRLFYKQAWKVKKYIYPWLVSWVSLLKWHSWVWIFQTKLSFSLFLQFPQIHFISFLVSLIFQNIILKFQIINFNF